jgi:ElaB/YqjD/DUF883 family membrane-anchored ribosome-binding protein
MEAELYDGTVLEFPDDTDPAVIQKVVKRETAKRQGSVQSSGATGSWGRGASGSWQDPTVAAMSPLERYRAGGKAGFGELALGVKQIFGKATPEDVDAYRQKNASLMEDPSARSGAISSHVAASTPLMMVPGGQTVVGSALLGGAYGAAQPVGTGESRVDKAITGAVISGGVTGGLKAIGRVAQPVANKLTDEAKNAVELLRKAGVRLSVGQQTGSRAAQGTERMLSNNPYTGPSMAAQGEKGQRSLTRAFLRTAGIDADAATPQVIGAAERRIGGGINTINTRYSLDINASRQDLTDLADEAQRILPEGGRRITAQVDEIVSKAAATGKLEAKAAQKIRTELGTLTRDPVVGEYAYKLRELLDDSLEQAARGTGDYAQLVKLRSQYRNLQAIASSADTTANAQVSGARLAQTLASGKYTRGSMRKGSGDTELSELARAASTVADRFPNSGTAAHAAAQMVAPTLVGGASFLQDGDSTKAMQLAAATYGLPKAAAGLLNNPAVANYLARGIPLPPASNQLAKYALRIAPPAATALVTSQ